MASIADLIEKYEKYSDEELIEVNSNIDNYSEEALEALNIVLKNKGGLETIQKRLFNKQIVTDEINRIEKETIGLSSKETSAEFIKTLISSEILSREEVDEIIDSKFKQFEAHVKDSSVNSKTITKAAIALLLATAIGSIYMWIILSNASSIPILFFVGLACLCYGIIRLITKKTKANTVVILAAFLSFLFSFLIGYGLTGAFGKPW